MPRSVIAVAVALVCLVIPSLSRAVTLASPGARLTISHRDTRDHGFVPRSSPLTLTDARGRPIAGIWQRWVDEARVSVWHGAAELDASDQAVNSECGAAEGGCYLEDRSEILISPDRGGRFGLYHELGHLFDAMTLTDADRAAFMRIWRVAIPAGMSTFDAWWRNESQADALTWGPPAEWFAEGYRLCATYGAWSWQTAFSELTYQYGYPAGDAWGPNGRSAKWAWAIAAQRATCRLIDAAARSRS